MSVNTWDAYRREAEEVHAKARSSERILFMLLA
jgi:hypothetical protein